jgi:hypothetical protein
MVGFCRSLLYAAFKVLLLIQLVSPTIHSYVAHPIPHHPLTPPMFSRLSTSQNAMAMVGAPTRDADALAAPDAAAPAAVVAGSAAENQVADGFLSWWVVFTPTYMAAILQIAFHLQKHLETAQSSRSRSTPRRPGRLTAASRPLSYYGSACCGIACYTTAYYGSARCGTACYGTAYHGTAYHGTAYCGSAC